MAAPLPSTSSHLGNRGTGLAEALIATAIVVTALSSLAALSTIAVRSVLVGRDRTLAAAFAQSKLDELRARPGPPAESPSDSLDHETGAWFEGLDGAGRVIGQDPEAGGRVFGRRWRVRAHPSAPGMFTMSVRAGRCVTGTGQGACGLAADAVVVAAFHSAQVR